MQLERPTAFDSVFRFASRLQFRDSQDVSMYGIRTVQRCVPLN
jgi:hypothetical protein